MNKHLNYIEDYPFTVNNPIHKLSIEEEAIQTMERPTKKVKNNSMDDKFFARMEKLHQKAKVASTNRNNFFRPIEDKDLKDYLKGEKKDNEKSNKITLKEAYKITGKDDAMSPEPEEDDLLTIGPKNRFKKANIDFASKCRYCHHTLCEGTTYATFCYDRLAIFDDDEEFETKEAFINVYFLLKDFEQFQLTRYANPDVEHASRNVPQCVLDTFKEHFRTGKSKFNEHRRGHIKHESEKK